MDGCLGIHAEYENDYIRMEGHRLATCRWQRFRAPVDPPRGGAPALVLTTPEGEEFYLDDLAYYPGATSWADMDDEEEW